MSFYCFIGLAMAWYVHLAIWTMLWIKKMHSFFTEHSGEVEITMKTVIRLLYYNVDLMDGVIFVVLGIIQSIVLYSILY